MLQNGIKLMKGEFMVKKQITNPSKKRHSKVKIGIIALITTCVVGVSSSFAFAKEVTVKVDGAETLVRGSLFQNVGEVLEANGIEVGEDYIVSVGTDTKLVEIEDVEVNKKAEGNLFVDGKTIAYKTEATTVEDLLAENNIKLGDLDRVEPSKGTSLGNISDVKVTRVAVQEVINQKEVPFTTSNQDNAELEVGTKNVVQAGVAGLINQTERVLYENGTEIKRELVKEEVVTEQVNEIIEVGTKVPVVEPPVVEPPVVEPPVVTPPVVEEAPVVTPPVVEEAPVVTPPVVEETPVETPPVVEEVPEVVAPSNPNFVSNPEGSGASRWYSHVQRALGELGLDTSDATISRVLKQIEIESGGDPEAINLWDSNAMAGYPSQGLLQTIPTTFLAFCRSGDTVSDITNGYANIYAGINYCAEVYGRTLPVWPTKGGY